MHSPTTHKFICQPCVQLLSCSHAICHSNVSFTFRPIHATALLLTCNMSLQCFPNLRTDFTCCAAGAWHMPTNYRDNSKVV
jgi:hypothetical protein